MHNPKLPNKTVLLPTVQFPGASLQFISELKRSGEMQKNVHDHY